MSKTPNIIYIYADDLGKGILSCYGQEKFKTPNIDRIANEGVRFTRTYANSFCAPSRASLICGIHDAHAGRWTFCQGGLYEKVLENELTVAQVEEAICNTGIDNNCKYLAEVLKEKGYYTGEIGKLEWGFSTCNEEMVKHGWDYHYGYYDHVQCHGYYPPFMFENGEKIVLEGNTAPFSGKSVEPVDPEGTGKYDMSTRQQYSQDLFDEKMLDFLDEHKDEPFFLFHPSQLPHGPAFYPEHHPAIKDNEDLLPLEKEYASMVLRLDDTVGKLLDKLDELGIAENTMVFFASDNGHECGYYRIPGRTVKFESKDGKPTNQIDNPFRTSTCGDVFNGNDGLAGLKFSNWDGGNRVVLMAKWPEKIKPGSVCDKLVSNYDTTATFADLTDNEVYNCDGVSFLPFLVGEEGEEHDYVVFSSPDGPAIVTKEGYKLRLVISGEVLQSGLTLFNHSIPEMMITQLYNVLEDEAELHDISEENPEIVQKLMELLLKECDGSFLNGMPFSHKSYYALRNK